MTNSVIVTTRTDAQQSRKDSSFCHPRAIHLRPRRRQPLSLAFYTWRGLPESTSLSSRAIIGATGPRSQQAAELVKLRVFAGLTVEQAASALGISRTTAWRHWIYARAWPRAEFGDQTSRPSRGDFSQSFRDC